MPIPRPATILPIDPSRERDALARTLATRWPAAARDVLLIAARVDRFNRAAPALGLAPLVADPPLAAAAGMWAAIEGHPTEARRG